LIELDLNAAGYLIDLDGTLISGRTALPDARRLFDALAGRFVIVSNDAEHTPRQVARMLASIGLDIAPQRIVLAGTTAIDLIAQERPGARVLLLGSAPLRFYARRAGLRLETSRPDIVLVMRDRRFSYTKLAMAAEAITRGAELVVAAPDKTHPGPDGMPVPETGALAAAILACVGDIAYRVVGKPEAAVFEIGCARLALDPADAVMIGDNPHTDGAGAARMGMDFVPVHMGFVGRSPTGQGGRRNGAAALATVQQGEGHG